MLYHILEFYFVYYFSTINNTAVSIHDLDSVIARMLPVTTGYMARTPYLFYLVLRIYFVSCFLYIRRMMLFEMKEKEFNFQYVGRFVIVDVDPRSNAQNT